MYIFPYALFGPRAAGRGSHEASPASLPEGQIKRLYMEKYTWTPFIYPLFCTECFIQQENIRKMPTLSQIHLTFPPTDPIHNLNMTQSYINVLFDSVSYMIISYLWLSVSGGNWPLELSLL